jgi:nucleoside-diphosphate-sugar epimerase
VWTALRAVGIDPAAALDIHEGDVAQPGLGLGDALAQRLERSIDEVWNSAASLSFLQSERDAIHRTNVHGMQNVLEFTEGTERARLHHISTAYVAGDRANDAFEAQGDVGQTFRNPYEASKCIAEGLIADAQRRGAVAATVYRPSVVIGDSITGQITHFHGVYGFIRGMWSVAERLRIRAGCRGVVELPLRIAGDTLGTLNFVPIDYVVDAIATIALRADSCGVTYHITNPHHTQNGLWLAAICQVLRVQGVVFVPPSDFGSVPLTKIEAMFQKQMAFHSQYFLGGPRFDCRRTLDALSDTDVVCPRITRELMLKLAGWYVARLAAEAAPQAVAGRQSRAALC